MWNTPQEQTNCKKVIIFLAYSKSKDDLHRHLKNQIRKQFVEESVDLRQTSRRNAGGAMMKKPQNYQSWAVVYEVEESTPIGVENDLSEGFRQWNLIIVVWLV